MAPLAPLATPIWTLRPKNVLCLEIKYVIAVANLGVILISIQF